MSYIFEDYSHLAVQELAIILGKVSHHIHQDIVEKIVEENIKFKNDFKKFNKNNNELAKIFLYEGSDCIFPGVWRSVGDENKNKRWKNNINSSDGIILNDNTYPRHLWAYLAEGKAYSGGKYGDWKKGLGKFELAHIFAHKTDERTLEHEVFKRINKSIKPYALFTSASNTVLIPKGIAKPTDNLSDIQKVFYRRHFDLYKDIVALPGLKDFDKTKVHKWYSDIHWNDPVRPKNWKSSIDNLLKYRNTHLEKKFKGKK